MDSDRRMMYTISHKTAKTDEESTSAASKSDYSQTGHQRSSRHGQGQVWLYFAWSRLDATSSLSRSWWKRRNKKKKEKNKKKKKKNWPN